MKEIETYLTYDDVLLLPQYSHISSRADIDLSTYITPNLKLKLPLLTPGMDTLVGEEMAEALFNLGAIATYPRFETPEKNAEHIERLINKGINVIPSIGIKPQELERAKLMVAAGAKVLTIDVAHAHQKNCIEMVKTLKSLFKGVELIIGVIATYEAAEDLFKAGADSVRVGVGPGTICTTREQTGSGAPQITATMEAYRAAQRYGKIIITDGGTKTHGDIVKSLAAGANAVVIGSQLAGTSEAPGKIVTRKGKKYKEYNGNTSAKEKRKQFSENSTQKDQDYVKHVEGTEALVPYKGPVADVLDFIEASLRSGLSYSGAGDINELHKKARFIRVSPIAAKENGAHGVITHL